MKKLLLLCFCLTALFACTQPEKLHYNYTLAIRYIDNTLDTVVVKRYGVLKVETSK